MTTFIEGPIMRPAKAAEYIGVSRAHIYRLIKDGRLPTPLQLSENSVGFPKPWLDAFITSCQPAKLGAPA